MNSKNKAKNNPFNTIFLAVCSFVGVGFITGAEIWFYFARFGWAMLVGLAVFAVLCFYLSYYCQVSNNSFPKKLSTFRNASSFVCEIFVSSAMISGLSEVSKTLFGGWWVIAFLLSIIIISLLLFRGNKSFVFYNYFVAGFIVFAIVILFLIDNNPQEKFSVNFTLKNCFSSALFSFFYAFMNIAEIKSILFENAEVYSKKQKIFVALFLSLILILLVITLSLLTFKFVRFSNDSMPFLSVIKTKSFVLTLVFATGLEMCMISTAEACLIGAKNKLFFRCNDENFSRILVILLSLLLSQISFKIFVQIIYPVIAILNFVMFILEIIFANKQL